jgi:hypothetical protein
MSTADKWLATIFFAIGAGALYSGAYKEAVTCSVVAAAIYISRSWRS